MGLGLTIVRVTRSAADVDTGRVLGHLCYDGRWRRDCGGRWGRVPSMPILVWRGQTRRAVGIDLCNDDELNTKLASIGGQEELTFACLWPETAAQLLEELPHRTAAVYATLLQRDTSPQAN